jgi:hypothetical protein
MKVDGRPPVPGAPVSCPIWVNETGYSESGPAVARDIDKWLVGTAYGVLLAIEVKFNKRKNSRIAGYVIFHSDRGTTVNRRACIFLMILNDYHLTVLGNFPCTTKSRQRSDCIHEARPLWKRATSRTRASPWRCLHSRYRHHSTSRYCECTKNELDTCLIDTCTCSVASPKCGREELEGVCGSVIKWYTIVIRSISTRRFCS